MFKKAVVFMLSAAFFFSLPDAVHAAETAGYEIAVPIIYEPVLYSNIQAAPFTEGLAAVRFGGKAGFIDKAGNVVIPFIYDDVLPFSEGLAAVLLDGKIGYIDKTGNEVIPLIYEGGEYLSEIRGASFSEGLAGVKLDGKMGFINASGNVVVPFIYDSLLYSRFSEGISSVSISGSEGVKQGFVDAAGNEIAPPIYDEVRPFSNGLAAVRIGGISIGGKYGFIDKSGNEVLPLIYNLPTYPYTDNIFSEGLAPVGNDGKWSVIDSNLNEVFTTPYKEIRNFSEGLAVFDYGGLQGVIDKAGNEIVPPKYRYISNFSEGMATIFMSEPGEMLAQSKRGVIDAEGNEIVPPIYADIGKFSEGYAAVMIGDAFSDGYLWGFIDKNGKEVVPPVFDAVREFSEGMAAVKLNQMWGYIKLADSENTAAAAVAETISAAEEIPAPKWALSKESPLYLMSMDILNQIIDENMTEAEKVKAVYDFMAYQFIRTDKGERHIDPTKTIFYETLLSNEYAYRPNETVVLNLLRAKTGVCEHFAAAFAFFLNDMLGIPAYTVHGQTINTEGVVKGHAWNIAIVDGEVYWFDSDLDDSLARRQGALTYRYFMKDTASFSGIGAHLWSDYYVNLANQLERIAQLPKTTLKYQNYPVTLIEPLTEKNGYIFYPFVDLMSCLLADVSLDRETRIMTGKLNGNVIEIPLDSPNYWVNGTKLDVAPELLPFIEGDYTYVYLDVVLESLGLSVSWDANTNTISVTD